jgi:AraC family transcriptional regulator
MGSADVIVTAAGHFVPWDGSCLFIGRNTLTVPEHEHYALQIVFGSTPGVRLRTSERDPWTAYEGAIVASRQRHSMDGTGVPFNAVLFVEPETQQGRALAERWLRGTGLAPLPESVIGAARDAVFAAWLERRSARAIADACAALVRVLTGGVGPVATTDERILRAIAYVNAHLDRDLTLADVAAEACLSPSRFRHLFVEQTGMALRPYILWRRFLRAWELVSAGVPLSTVAHEAGFADAAHLSRTSRRMFGFPPSAMETNGPFKLARPGAAPGTPDKSALSFK